MIGPLDQRFGSEQPPLGEIHLVAEQSDTAGIIEERLRINKTKQPGEVQVGAQNLIKLVSNPVSPGALFGQKFCQPERNRLLSG